MSPSKKGTATPPPDELVPLNFRLPRSLLEALDEWIEELNQSRRLAKVTRSDVVRALIEEGVAHRPDLDRKPEASKR